MRLYAISTSIILLGMVLLGALQSPRTPALAERSRADAPGVAAPPYARIRALTYNIFMRPAPVSWRDQNGCRARRIARYLRDELEPRDIIVLTESFEASSVQILADATRERYPHQVLSQPPARGLSVNGGVSLLSPHPIEAWSATAFDTCYGDWNDCLATKGFVWARLRISDSLKLNVLATHLNSGGGPQPRATRRKQLTQIRDFLNGDPSFARWPTLFMGDLNINGLRWEARHPKDGQLSEFGETMRFLGNTCVGADAHTARDCLARPVDTFRATHKPWRFDEAHTLAVNTYNCLDEVVQPCRSPNAAEHWRRRLRIDYILDYGAPAKAPELTTRLLESNTLEFLDNSCNTNYLSDHRALETTLEIGDALRVEAQLDTAEPASESPIPSPPFSAPN